MNTIEAKAAWLADKITTAEYQAYSAVGKIPPIRKDPIKVHKVTEIKNNTTPNKTDLISLTKTGKTRFYIIIGVFLLIILYLEGSLFKKIITKNWYK